MKHLGKNISVLDRMMNTDSLAPEYGCKFGATVTQGYIDVAQAGMILTRAHHLYDRIGHLKEKIYELYGKEPTDKLVANFSEIISYSDKVMSYSMNDTFDEFFQKLEGFCGQIENIIKMIRYYYTLFVR